MRLRVRDLKEIFLEPRLKGESKCIESDEESVYSYGSSVSLLVNIKVLKNSVINKSTGEIDEGSVEIMYQGEYHIKKGDRVFIKVSEQEKTVYKVDDVIRYTSHLWAMLKVCDV
ncbi:MAG: hypothetical protein ACRCWM_12950 [Sarcina sp.]